MSAKDPFSILNRNPGASSQQQEPAGKKATVQRLRAGQLPQWALQESNPDETEFKRSQAGTHGSAAGSLKFKGMTADASGIIIDTSQGKAQEITSFGDQQQAEVVGGDERRAKIRQKMLELERLQQEQAAEQQVNEEGDDEDDEGLFGDEDEMPVVVVDENKDTLLGSLSQSEDEEEEDGDYEQVEEEQVQTTLLKPVFVSRQDREVLQVTDEKRQIELDEAEERAFQQRSKEERRQYTKQLVAEAVRRDLDVKEHEAQDGLDSDDNLPAWALDEDDDREYLNSQQAYEEWKIRELRRLKRERDERQIREKELKEIERRRNMTDAERQEENLRLGSDHTSKKERVAYKFMQRFYHKGAFFQGDQDSNPLFQRDYNMPVGEDKMDKSVLPAVLQKRRGNLGTKGNSKWTHLTGEDTTNFDPIHRVPDQIAFKTQLKQGGYKAMHQLDRPSTRKRMH